jgi:hypothetical protein
MRYVLAAAIIAVSLPAVAIIAAPPAQAQFSTGKSKEKTPLDLIYERQERERMENERQYNMQMKRLKAQGPTSTSRDPWKGVRSTADGKR